jgi:hypothetical protein
MSKVKIVGNASGSGTLTLTGPNTNSDRTLTLPDGTGTLALTTGDDDKLPLAGGTLTGNLDVTMTSVGDGIDLIDTHTAHGITDYLPTDASLRLTQQNATEGGGRIVGATDNTGQHGLSLYGLCQDGAVATVNNIQFVGAERSGTGIAAVANDKSVLKVFNNTTELFDIKGSGDAKLSGEGTEVIMDIFSDSGSSRGAGYFRFKTDGASAEQSVAQIYMEQGSGDGAARKCNMYFQVSDNGAPATSISIANNGVASGDFNDTSDVNLKENIVDMGSATSTLKALKPRIFDWKKESKASSVAGFIAQEVAETIPTAVSGDEFIEQTFYTEEDDIPDGSVVGDEKEQGNMGKAINTTSILAYAVKTIQELEARIKTLENA